MPIKAWYYDNTNDLHCFLLFFLATESPRPRHSAAQRHHHDSYDLTENINYNFNGPSNFTGEEAIYDEIATGAAGTSVGCRRHGVYAFNNEEMNEMEPYNSAYDVVL